MDDWNVAVHDNATIVLGGVLCCDGQVERMKLRAQTHIHLDHMKYFESSMRGKIYMLKPSRELLCAQNPAWSVRNNIIALSEGEKVILPDETGEIELHDSGHMLGSAQVIYTDVHGYKVGYSGDFNLVSSQGKSIFPIQVDQLVIDGTSGPRTIREYTQQAAEEKFLSEMNEKFRSTSIVVTGDTESIFRALEVMDALEEPHIILDPNSYSLLKIYESYGCSFPRNVESVDMDEAEELLDKRNCIYLRRKGTRLERRVDRLYVRLMPFYNQPSQPICYYSENSCDVGFSNHSDFNDTMAYIGQIKDLTHVLVDNSRSGSAVDIALEIQSQYNHLKVDYKTVTQKLI